MDNNVDDISDRAFLIFATSSSLDFIASFKERVPEFVQYYEWYDYDSFDEAYMRIWEETDINQRFIDYSDHHPEIWDTP